MPESAYILSQGGLSAVDVSDGDKRAEVVMIGDVSSGLLDQLSVIGLDSEEDPITGEKGCCNTLSALDECGPR